MNKKNSILYIINFYGTPPLNYFEKHINANKLAELVVLKLPSVKLEKECFIYNGFIMNTRTQEKRDINIKISISLPDYLQYLLQYILNPFFLLFFVLTFNPIKYDIGIGETSFGATSIYILKLIGIVKYSIYMNGDIVPPLKGKKSNIYISSHTIDNIYLYSQHLLRRLGFKNDLVWYSNNQILQQDRKANFIAKDTIVSQAVLTDKIEIKNNLKIKKDSNTVCYIGRLDENAGVDISIKALKYVKKKIPDIKFLVLGGGGVSVDKYKQMAEKYGVSQNIHFYGFVPDMQEAYNIIIKSKLGLALYKPDDNNPSMYSEPSKPKEYIRLGIPVLSTLKGPNIGYEIEKYKAGFLVDYNPKSIAKVIIKILQDEKNYKKLAEGIIAFGKDYDYRKVNEKLFSEITRRRKTSNQ